MRILVVDDEKIKRVSLTDDLQEHGFEVAMARDGDEALRKMEVEAFDVVVADLKMPRLDGLELLKRIKEGPGAHAEVIIMTAYGSIPVAVEAMKRGAFDFLTKPFRNEEILPLLERIRRRARPRVPASPPRPGARAIDALIVGDSPPIRQVKNLVEICARTDATVLLRGETGSGKDLTASIIHRRSHRRSRPLVKVSCAAFPQLLVESELYGHEKGAFTGAAQQKIGRFELAQGGTLYLDDVDDIPLDHQVKLLRVIDEKVFERVGGTRSIRADVRIIASTKRDLLARIEEGAFREDLYYRLNVLHIEVPSLRERPGDIPLLVEHLLRRAAGRKKYRLEPKALEVLEAHRWPGNVRELAHTLERVYLLGQGTISADLVSAELGRIQSPARAGGFRAIMDQTERDLLLRALKASRGNKSAAARSLGMKLSTFREKLAKHGLG